MFTIKVIVDLPFFLRLEKPLTVHYEKVCKESLLLGLRGKKVKITFSRRPVDNIDRSAWTRERSTITIKVNIPASLSDESISTFAIYNCREIINNIISSYQATTLEFDNAGFIILLGTAYMHLFAKILVNDQDIRDRSPSWSYNTLPLEADRLKEFRRYLRDSDKLPLSRLFLVNARLSLEQGQYSLAVVQAAMAVELRLTQVIHKKLIIRRWPNEAIEPFERLTLGQKLIIKGPRSLNFYFSEVAGFTEMYKKLDAKINQPRNDVIHRGYLASRDEAVQAVGLAGEFYKIVN